MNYQILLHVSHGLILVGIILTGLGGYGAYWFREKVDLEKKSKPFINLCSPVEYDFKSATSTHFSFPYCSQFNSVASNANLFMDVLHEDQNSHYDFIIKSEPLATNLVIGRDPGVRLNLYLNDYPVNMLNKLVIVIHGNFQDDSMTQTFHQLDIYRLNPRHEWGLQVGSKREAVVRFLKENQAE